MAGEKKTVHQPANSTVGTMKEGQTAKVTMQPTSIATTEPTRNLVAAQTMTRTPTLRLVVTNSSSSTENATKVSGEISAAAKGRKEGVPRGNLAKTGGTGAKLYRNPRVLARGSNGTHRPIGPRGAVVLAKDNTNLDYSKATKGVVDPKKMTIRFKDTKGDYHEHKFPGHSAKKWDDEEWIKSLNKWRYQTFNRKFKRDGSIARGNRGRWSLAEKNFVQEQLRNRIEETGDRMLAADWKLIAKAHKEKFEGKVVKKGEALLDGAIASKEYTITERSHVAVRAAFEKMKDLKEMVEELVAQYVTDEESSDDENTMQGVIAEGDEKHGGEIDHHLEDPSDDEEDGQQPAANPTGAVLLSVC